MSVNKVNSDGSLSRVAGGTLYADLPVGSIIPYGGGTVKSGFLLCNGAEVLKTAYAELYAAIGDVFGTASDNTKFKLPDLREATTKGVGLNGRSAVHYDADGVALGEFIEDRVQDHLHRTHLRNTDYQLGGVNMAPVTDDGQSGLGTVGDIVVGRHGATTEVKSVGVNYIIKAKQVALPADFTDYMKDFVKSELVQINVPAQTGVGEYSVTKTLTIPTGYKFLAFGSVSCVHYNQVIMSALFDDNTNVATIRIYNDYGNIIALNIAVKVWVLYAKV